MCDEWPVLMGCVMGSCLPMVYAGIGSRKQGPSLMLLMMRLGATFAALGWRLGSGGATGADDAFEAGARAALDDQAIEDRLRIYLPREGFEGRFSQMPGCVLAKALPEYARAQSLARQYHPAPGRLTDSFLALMARNSFQALQEDLDSPVRFILCSTPDACIDGNRTSRATGGTGQALRLAAAYQIPIFNLQHGPHRERMITFLCRHRALWEPHDAFFQERARVRATEPDALPAWRVRQRAV